MQSSPSFLSIIAPFLAGAALIGVSVLAARLLRARYDVGQIAEERGGAGCLLTATIGSVLLALLALGMGFYSVIVYWIMPR